MKRNCLILLVFSILMPNSLDAQDVNWRAIDENTHHLVSAYFGADYNSYYGLSYGYVLKTDFRPVVIGTEITVPFGRETLDDWKWKTGAQAEIWNNGSLSLALKPSLILRRYESPLARMYNIGADIPLTFGFIKPKWGIVTIASYDMAISTHIKHGYLREYYPEIRDGWYGASGGNFKFGTRVHLSLSSWNAFLTLGKHYGQDFKDNPTLPFFAEFSIQRQLTRKNQE